jgi:hypothetical protein
MRIHAGLDPQHWLLKQKLYLIIYTVMYPVDAPVRLAVS